MATYLFGHYLFPNYNFHNYLVDAMTIVFIIHCKIKSHARFCRRQTGTIVYILCVPGGERGN